MRALARRRRVYTWSSPTLSRTPAPVATVSRQLHVSAAAAVAEGCHSRVQTEMQAMALTMGEGV